MKHSMLCAAIMTLFLTACGGKTAEPEKSKVGTGTAFDGDSTLYGLACDGCTDSVLVFLPGQGGDPVTYDIIQARKQQRVMGRPKVGDWVCLLVNKENKRKADFVIDLDELKGNWVCLEKPKRRKLPNMGPHPKLEGEEKQKMDSMIREQMKPVEIGFALKRHYTAHPIGMRRNNDSDENNLLIYPEPKFYTGWHIFNGRLVLIEGALSAGNKRKVKKQYLNDTVDITLMMKDSLRLRFKDGAERGYYRK